MVKTKEEQIEKVTLIGLFYIIIIPMILLIESIYSNNLRGCLAWITTIMILVYYYFKKTSLNTH